MKVWGVTEDDVAEAIATANERYAGNLKSYELRTEGKRVRTVAFMLRTRDCRGLGSRRTKHRRTTSACWHAHRDVLRALFAMNPDARVKTMLADYRGARDFETQYPETCEVQCWQGGFSDRDRREECACTGDEDGDVRDDYYPLLSADAHRVHALADAELAEWAAFLASASRGRTTVRQQ